MVGGRWSGATGPVFRPGRQCHCGRVGTLLRATASHGRYLRPETCTAQAAEKCYIALTVG